MQVKDVGESKCLAVVDWIVAYAITGNGADFQLVFNCKIIGRTELWGKANDGIKYQCILSLEHD
jgi:hypothetical protein